MTPRRLHEHIGEALEQLGRYLVAQSPTPEWRDHVADWLEHYAGDHVTVELSVDHNGRGRVDTRSQRASAFLQLESGARVRLCSVLVRDLVDADGRPIDVQEDARTLLLQNGHGIPDSPAALEQP